MNGHAAEQAAAGTLHRICYMSRATGGLDGAELDALASQSSGWNRSVGLTGLLLHDGVRFIQALEGGLVPLRAVMTRINADGRHHAISMVADGAIGAREFGDWAMAVRRTDSYPDGRAFLAQVKADVAGVVDTRLRAAFIGFAAIGWR